MILTTVFRDQIGSPMYESSPKADMMAPKSDFRFTPHPGSGLKSNNAPRVRTGLMHRSKPATSRGRSCKVRPLSPSPRIPPY
jgi:hypothetical protein